LTRGTGLKQGDFRQNLDANISDKVKLTVTLNGSLKENHMMAGGNTTGGATGAISNVALYSAPYVRSEEELALTTPNLADRATVWTWVDDFEDLTKENSFRGSLDLSWKINNFLSYNLRSGGNISNEDRSRWYNITLYDGAMQNGYLTQAQMNRSNYSLENILQFNHAIKNLVDINATAGITYDAYSSLNSLTVGNTGKIEGKINCQIADIAGRVKDDLHVHELLTLRASSNISGNIFYKEIDIEKGAKVTGQLSML